MRITTLIATLMLLPLVLVQNGCAVASLAGGMMQNAEYQKKVRVYAEYDGLAHERVAVLVSADMGVYYDFPLVPDIIATAVAARIATYVEGVSVIDPRTVKQWQYRTPQWQALPYGDIVEGLNVDRVVFIDLYEYRLHPPGNSYEWEGRVVANIGVIERDGFSADDFADTFRVQAQFPPIRGVSTDSARAGDIQTGLMQIFIKETAYLFYMHERPKYPDKYQGSDV